MFSLIITVISIALVAVLAVASIYYGGSAMSQGTAKANASTLVNHGQQLNGANAMFKNDNGGSDAGGITALVTAQYLSAAPVPPAFVVESDSAGVADTWTINGSVFEVNIVSAETCAQVQKQAVADTSIPSAYPSAQTFGCYGAASPYTVFYKL